MQRPHGKRAGETRPGASRDRRLYERAVTRYLQDCYRRRAAASVAEFADLVGFSRPHVSAVFIEVFGRSLSKVLRERQVERAEELLARTGKSLAEVAAASGFGTERTFYRVFRALRGMTPGFFRKT